MDRWPVLRHPLKLESWIKIRGYLNAKICTQEAHPIQPHQVKLPPKFYIPVEFIKHRRDSDKITPGEEYPLLVKEDKITHTMYQEDSFIIRVYPT